MYDKSTESDERLRKFDLYNVEHIGRDDPRRLRPGWPALIFLVFVACGIGLGAGRVAEILWTDAHAARIEGQN